MYSEKKTKSTSPKSSMKKKIKGNIVGYIIRGMYNK